MAPLEIAKKLRFFDRRVYTLQCNWKVYVDNYLDGGYHVPHAHKGLSSVIEYTKYTIENFERACLQSSPLSSDAGSEAGVASTRQGRAFYLWIYPNFMLNAYEGVMDTNLVVPLAVDKCAVIFDYYFSDISAAAEARNRESIAVSEKVQDEDVGICDAVQRGLGSRAYLAGRLSVRREAGEHLFHRLLHADLSSAVDPRLPRTSCSPTLATNVSGTIACGRNSGGIDRARCGAYTDLLTICTVFLNPPGLN